MGIDFLTRGSLVPEIPAIRHRMGKAGNVPTNTADAERCVESYDNEMTRLKRRPLRYERLQGSQHMDLIEDALRGGAFVHLAIHYGTFNERVKAAGGRTGDPNFNGKDSGHSVGLLGWKRDEQGRIWWRLWDPLDDRRRPIIPKGPRWVRRSVLVASWRAFGSYCGILRGGERTP
jgi:hypothetical protein